MRQILASSVFVFLMVANVALPGQETTPKIEFEVASMRKAAPPTTVAERLSNGVRSGGPGSPDPERISFLNVPLDLILAEAFDVQRRRISGPDWIDEVHYDIVAKVPLGATTGQSRLMLQALLRERLHLASHFESKTYSGYELVVAPNGPKLKISETSPSAPVSLLPPELKTTLRDEGFPELAPGVRQAMVYARMDEITRYRFSNTSTAELASILGERLGTERESDGRHSWIVPAAVVDKTGLSGRYD